MYRSTSVESNSSFLHGTASTASASSTESMKCVSMRLLRVSLGVSVLPWFLKRLMPLVGFGLKILTILLISLAVSALVQKSLQESFLFLVIVLVYTLRKHLYASSSSGERLRFMQSVLSSSRILSRSPFHHGTGVCFVAFCNGHATSSAFAIWLCKTSAQ